jgi:prephenate dehydrogenase
MDALPSTFAAIGGHPMCGKETSGLASADGDLYRDRTFVLCRSLRTTPAAEASVLALVAAVGARPVFLPAAEHDALVAAVSHLPYAAAAALMRLVTDEAAWEISASGFRDVSRLAGSDTRMILDILMTNRPAILVALRDYQAELAALTVLLEGGDEPQLSEWVAASRVRHAAYRRHLSARAPGEEGERVTDQG